jgi:hypothetical protein
MAKLTKFWVVRDPSPVSEINDILFESDPVKYAAYCVGAGYRNVKDEHTAVYTTEGEAKKDALARLQAEKKPVSPYRAPPPEG